MRIARNSLVVLAIVVLAQLVGCANVPKQAYNRAANQDIKKIAILKTQASNELLVQNWGHPGLGFGLIGGLVAAADMQSKTTNFTAKLKPYNFDPAQEFTSALAEELRAGGYEVKVIEVARPKPAMLESYDALDPEPDAYVDSVLNWSGYFTASAVANYQPAMHALVRVVKRRTKEIAYQELINYGYEMRGGKSVNISADRKYSFGNFDALMASPDLALEGMRNGIPLLVKQVGRDLMQDEPAKPLAVSDDAKPLATAGHAESAQAVAQPQEAALKPQ